MTIFIFGMFVLAVSAECILRRLRYGDFPVYCVDSEIGYVPRALQAGSMQGNFPWMLNERSMWNEPFVADSRNNVLLIGDSIVYGEVRMKPNTRLGACLQANVMTGRRVWSVGAGSWSVLNEIAYLERQGLERDLRQIIWIVNADDFGARSGWQSSYAHPRRDPLWLTGYLVGKKLHEYRRMALARRRALSRPTFSGEARDGLARWLRSNANLVPECVWVWYPHKADMLFERSDARQVKESVRALIAQHGGRFYDLCGDRRWQIAYYNDSIHPTLEGRRVLASILAEQL